MLPRPSQLHLPITRQMMYMCIVASVAPLLIISTILYAFYDVAYREKARANLEEQVLRKTQGVDSFIKEKASNIRLEAQSFSIEDLSRPELLRERLHKLQDAYTNVYTDLGIVDASGTQIAYVGPYQLEKADYSAEPWFQTAINQPEFISDVFLGKRNSPHFIITTRIATGDRPWLLRATVDFARLSDRVRDFRIGSTGQAYILNRAGQFQTYHQPPIMLPTAVALRLARLPFPDGAPGFVQDVDSMDIEQFFVCAPLKNGEWIFVSQQERSEALRLLTRARMTAAATVLLGSIGIVLSILLMTKRMELRILSAETNQEQMQRQVVEAGKLAAIGELAAGIAHEINNPLAIMMENSGWIEDLLQSDDFQSEENMTEIRASLKTIVTQGHRCKDITHRLLSFARKSDSCTRKANVNALLEDIVGFAHQKAKYSGVLLTSRLDPNVPEIEASPTEVQQVVLNLVNNAIDAIDKEGGMVTICSAREIDFVRIDVRDNGQGMSEEVRSRIFEPFFTTKPTGKGTGLGLAISRDIVKKMGGSIEVETTLGLGTTFHVRLPLTPPQV